MNVCHIVPENDTLRFELCDSSSEGMCVRVCACMRMCFELCESVCGVQWARDACVCVCVCERERERERVNE